MTQKVITDINKNGTLKLQKGGLKHTQFHYAQMLQEANGS